MRPNVRGVIRTLIAWSLPFVAAMIQWTYWIHIQPYVWMLFYPTVMIAPWVGGLYGGIGATFISAFLSCYVFMPPAFSLNLDNPSGISTAVLFSCVGIAYSLTYHRMRVLQRKHDAESEHRIADYQMSERQLKAAQRDLKEAQRIAHVAYSTWDPQTDVNLWSEETFRLFGLDPASGTPSFAKTKNLITPETYAGVAEAMARTIQTGEPYEVPLDIIRPDGSIRHTIAKGELIPGEKRILCNTAIDVTELQEAREALRQYARELDEAQRISGIGSWSWDSKKDIPVWSSEMFHLFGLDPRGPTPSFAEQHRFLLLIHSRG